MKTINLIRKVSPDGTICTVAGGGTNTPADGLAATTARLDYPTGVAADATGNLFISEQNRNRLYKVTPDGTISVIAGRGTAGFSGDGGAAIAAEVFTPFGIAVDNAGNLYIADLNNQRVRKVLPIVGASK